MESSSTTIDFAELLNNPDYLNNMDFNLGSIENLLIRRKRAVQSGKEEFTNGDFLTDWVIFPNFAIDDLGNHLNACLVPILSWQGANTFSPEDERFETDMFNAVFGTIVSTETLTDDVTIFVENVGAEYFPPDPPASIALDFFTPINPSQNLIIDADVSQLTLELLTVINDGIPEGNESTGFQFDIVDDNNTGATVELQGDIFDIKIKELPTSTSDLGFSSKLNVYPSLVSDLLTIESADSTLKIDKIKIFAVNGKSAFDFELDAQNQVTVNLSTVTSSGYHLLVIETNKGIATKRIYKL